MLGFALLTAWLALARYGAVHNRTFDLALYARTAWGLVHMEAWDPIVGGNFLGGHVPLVLLPLGALGALLGTVPVLLVCQSVAVALVAVPIARFGARRLGATGGLVGALAWLLYPNLGHATTYEFHPGMLGLLPMALALDALDRREPRALLGLCAATVACRASLALQTLMIGLLALLGGPELRQSGKRIALGSLAYFLLWQAVLVPLFGEAALRSADLHFGKWGGSPLGVLGVLVRHPGVVLAHFSAPERLSYPLRLLAPLCLLPLLRPRWLLVALPPVALNLLSQFPTATTLAEHYSSFAVPPLLMGALDGLHALLALPRFAREGTRPLGAAGNAVGAESPERSHGLPGPDRGIRSAHDTARFRASAWRALGLAALLGAAVSASVLGGGLPWSRDFQPAEFRPDAYTRSARKVLALVGAASVQAPDPLLPHLAERRLVCRVPPPEREADFVVFDIGYRRRFLHNEDLLRTTEEPLLRRWLARDDHGVAFADDQLVVLRRGQRPRSGLVNRYFVGYAPPDSGVRLTDCLAVRGAELHGDLLSLELIARKPCPGDLAIHLGADHKPKRTDLLFDGVLSPAHLARGDLLRSQHRLSDAERRAIVRRGLNVGALRSSGARPHPYDPISVEVPLHLVR